MARMLRVLAAVGCLEMASAAWKHRQLFQPERPAARLSGCADETCADLAPVQPVEESASQPVPVAKPRADWERRFKRAVSLSGSATAQEGSTGVGRWMSSGSGAMPPQMLEAEQLMEAALRDVPEDKVGEQRLVLATRLYYHAKWLAERQLASVAEERYLRCRDLALESGNEELAAHALSRLGYFLSIWHRPEDAQKMLQQAVELPSEKPNNLASYLLGSLERKAAGSNGDAASLLEADKRILASHKVPSKDLEDERVKLVSEIQFWREAESSPAKCLESSNVVHAMICGAVHMAKTIESVLP